MRAVLVFCEGSHDVAFTQRSLGAVAQCKWVSKSIRELPSPFGKSPTASKGLLATRLERRGIEDLNLQMATHPPLPSFEAIVEDTASKTMFMLIRTSGKYQVDPVHDLLRDLQDTFDETLVDTYDVAEYAAAFLFDANTVGMTATIDDFRQRYDNHFGDLSGVDHGTWDTTEISPVGCFVFHDRNDDRTGTLEDHLAPMVNTEWPDRYAKAYDFINDYSNESDKVSGSGASQLKAVITAAGQFRVPGAGLTQVIGRGGLSQAVFEESSLSQELVAFLMAAPWAG